MNIPITEIINFHKQRTLCHVMTMNYFAQLLGYHFPEHDSDKNTEPYLTGYAYYNYVKHHPGSVMLPQQQEIFNKVHDEHHKMQPHHVEHYNSMKEIPDIFLIEMVCDWHSANFEQNIITCENEFASVSDFFNKSLSKLDWSTKQKNTIKNLIDKISKLADYSEVRKIWTCIN